MSSSCKGPIMVVGEIGDMISIGCGCGEFSPGFAVSEEKDTFILMRGLFDDFWRCADGFALGFE
jgi:hypothetical protein